MTHNAMNAVFAWALALGICALATVISGYFFLSTVSDLLNLPESSPEVFWAIWAGFGFVGAFFALRPLENFIRRMGYGLKSVEETTKLDDGDAIGEDVEKALADRLRDELGRD